MFQSLIKVIPSLLYSILLLALFYWQFNTQFTSIINAFSQEKLSLLYAYLFLYLFGLFLLVITVVNLIHYLIHEKAFVVITLCTLTIFYLFSLTDFAYVMEYFIHYPLDSYTIMGMIFFMVLIFAYALYSMVILYFKDTMPLSHIITFVLLALGYMLYFIQNYGKPLF